MNDFYFSKKEISKRVLLELYKDKTITDKTIDIALKKWWKNVRQNGGYRLTHEGYEAFNLANIQYWTFTYEADEMFSLSQVWLEMDKYIKCPYYIRAGKGFLAVDIYDSRIAALLVLYGGSVKEYISMLKR